MNNKLYSIRENMETIDDKEKNDQETIYGAITIFCKKSGENLEYLVVENTETGNISFVSGAKEGEDKELIDTARREIREELHIPSESYRLIPTTVRHEFLFGQKKKERAGKNGSYQVFWADASKLGDIHHTKELSKMTRMTKEEVLQTLTFDDLKEVFEKASGEIIL